MELTFITAGQIVNTHGVRGEVKLLPQGVEPELLAECDTLYIEGQPRRLTAGRGWTTWTPPWRSRGRPFPSAART